MHSNNDFSKFPRCLRPNMQELCTSNKLGLSVNDIKLIPNKHGDSYHYVIKIPYAGKKLTWEIMFNPGDFEFAPDFYFNEEEFMNDPEIEDVLENIPALTSYDLNNCKSITELLTQFLHSYKKFHIEKLRTEVKHEKVREAFDSLLKEDNVSVDDVELYVDTNVAHLLIKLNFDFGLLDHYIQTDLNNLVDPGPCFVHLRLTYTCSGNKVSPFLEISAKVEQCLGCSKFKIPPWKPEFTALEYIDMLKIAINERIAMKREAAQKRKMFICQLISDHNKDIIEYDLINLMYCCIAYNVEDRKYAVKITLDSDFPQKRPHLLVIFTCSMDCKMVIRNFQWNPSGDVDKMLENLYACLDEELPKAYKSHKH